MAGQCILAVECDWRIRRLIRVNLEAVGLQVHEAVSSLHARFVLAQIQPDLVLLDLECLELGARDLLAALHEELVDRKVPVLGLSSEPADSQFVREGVMVGHLQKPFAVSALLREVRQALDGRPASG